jgi:CRP/FNR family transcriptional regulator
MSLRNFYLRQFELSRLLTDEQLFQLGESLTIKESSRKEVIYSEGADNKIYFLINGKVKISEIKSDGYEYIKFICSAGDVFGDIYLNNSNSKLEFAEVLTSKVIYYVINKSKLIQLLQNSALLAFNYAATICSRSRRIENFLLNMKQKDVRTRLEFYLNDLAQREGKRVENMIVVKNSLTHEDLANIISSSRQTVTLVLNELKELGLICYTRN